MPVINLNSDKTLRAIKTKSQREDFRDASWTNDGSFGVRVYSSGKKVFFFMYQQGRKRKRYQLGEYPVIGLAEAKHKAIKTLDAVNEKQDPQATKQAIKTGATVDDIFESYIEIRSIINAKGTGPTAISTLKNNQSMYSKDIKPLLGHLKAASVTRLEASQTIEKIARRSGIMSNRAKEMMSAVFSLAVERGVIESNPFFRLKDLGVEKVGERYLNITEIRNYWNLSAELSTVNRVYLRLLLLTGARPGEIMKLRWSYFDSDTLILPREIIKTRNTHRLILPKQAITEVKLLRANKVSDEFLFPGDTAGEPRRSFRDAETKLIDKMESSKWTLRDVRRTCETWMRKIKIPGYIVSEVLNHGRTRDKISQHYDKNDYAEEKREALEKWALWIEAVAEGKEGVPVNINDYRHPSDGKAVNG